MSALFDDFYGQPLRSVVCVPIISGFKKGRCAQLWLLFDNGAIRVGVQDSSDELQISRVSRPASAEIENTVHWKPSVLGDKKLVSVWIAVNDRGYQDLLVIALDVAVPCLSVCAIAGELQVLTLAIPQ